MVFGAVLWAGCSSDPNQRKLNYLKGGEKYLQVGKYREAVIEFRNALQIDPRFAEAHYQLGRAYLELKDPKSAYRELNSAVALDPNHRDAQLELAAMFVAVRQYQQAQTILEKVLGADPKNIRAHMILAEKYTATRELPKAIAELKTLNELDPHRVEGYGALGAVYLAAGQVPEAEAAYQKAIDENPRAVQARVAMAEFYLSRGKPGDAGAALRAGCDLDAHAVLPRILLARLYVTTGRLDDAEKLYVQLKKVAPDNPQAYQALGLFYMAAGQTEKATAEFLAIAAAKPKDLAVKGFLVETLLNLNRFQEAARINQQILSANPSDPRGLLSQGRILLADGKYSDAEKALEKSIQSDDSSALSYYFLGVAQRSLGQSELAKASFSYALKLSPQMAEASVALAGLETKSDPNEALRLAGNALKSNPNLPSAYWESAQATMAKGDTREAEAQIEEALKRNPRSVPALATYMSLCMRQGKVPQAMQRISALVQQFPNNAGYHFLFALGYFSLKDVEKSETSLKQAMALDPKLPEAYTLLADIDLAKGQAEKAKADLRTAIAAKPQKVSNYMTLATQYEKEGNWGEAKKLCEQAHVIDPSAPVVAAELAFLYLEHGGDVNQAVSLAQMAKQQMPNSPITADALGWAYYKLGSADSAIKQLKESALKVPDNAMYQYHLGMAYMAGRHFDLARRSLQTALKNDPDFLDAASARAALDKLPKSAPPAAKRDGASRS